VAVAAIFVIAGGIAVTGPAGGTGHGEAAYAAGGERLPDLAGSWLGTWEDTIYVGFSGDLSWTIYIDGSTMTANGIIDLSDLGLGLMPGSAEGTISGEPGRSTLDFTFTAGSVGGGVGTITGNLASGSGNVIPPLDFGAFTFQATVSDTQMRGTFDFTSPGGGAGKVLMTKDTPVEASSWGVVKDRYRAGNE
jgi:hypothetical protein